MSVLAVTTDPGAWIAFSVVLGAAVGFMACALFASRRIREDRRANWWEGYAACNRDHARRREHQA